MNLTGKALYSKATKGLKRRLTPGDIDQQFKLVFIYPMLFDNTLTAYEKTLRDFISVSMLKEIFVSNALSIVAMASKRYDHDPLEVQALINKSVQMGQAGGDPSVNYSVQDRTPMRPEINQYDLQKKIKEKTAIIRKYLANEPRIKKLNPFVEVITLENLIDVPVIVGTKQFQVDSLVTAYVLAAAIALKKPLGGPQAYTNLKYVLNVIKTLDEEDAWVLFDKMVDNSKPSIVTRINDRITMKHPRLARMRGSKYIQTPLNMARRVIGSMPSTTIKGQENIDPTNFYKGKVKEPEEGSISVPGETFKRSSQFDILEVVKDNLDDVELFFKFMIYPDLLKSQFGLSGESGQTIRATEKIQQTGQLSQLINQAQLNFKDYMGSSIANVISSAVNIIYPTGSQVDFKDLKSIHLDNGLIEDADSLANDYAEALVSSFSSEDVNTKKAKILTHLCGENFKSDMNKIEKFSRRLRDLRIESPRFNIDQLTDFLKALEQTSSVFSGIHDKLTHQLNLAVDSSRTILESFDASVDKHINALMTTLQKDMIMGQGNMPTNIPLTVNFDNNGNPIMDDPVEVINTITQIVRHIGAYIKPFYYISLIGATCQYVDYFDIEIDTVKNDVLDLPNYTLVLPVETILMLHSAVVAKSWRELVDKGKGKSEVANVTDNYVKGIVKFVNKRLDIPNLIVIDTKRKQVFYKLQYMTGVNKSNLQTFETYVKNLTKQELESPSY